jgi:aminoglycoside N3'-acetyltransferase
LVDGWLEARALQRRGQVGYAEARLMRAQDVVDVVVAQVALPKRCERLR